MKNPSASSGQASLVLVLVLGLVAILAVLSSGSLAVSNVQIEETIYKTNQAWYAAWSGVDELMYRLRSKQDFGSGFSVSLSLSNGATVSAEITGDNIQKTIRSSGFADGIIKRLEVSIASSSSKASFIFAAQSGEGGFELEGSTSVSGTGGSPGNVYSNGSILGVRASTGISGSKILGSAWAVNNIGGLSSLSSGGVYIKQNAWSASMLACLVDGNTRAASPPSNCPYFGAFTLSTPPPPVPLASVDSNYWKNRAESGGVWNGNCTVMATDGTDCTGGTGMLGNIRINGDFFLPSGLNMTVTGPIWVVGNVNISQNNTIFTSESAGKNSLVIVASDPNNNNNNGRVVTSSNVQFSRNSEGAGLIFISENTGIDCGSSPAIDMTSNTATVVFVAVDGCINVGSNSVISGILAKKVHISNNSRVEYDPSLARAIVAPDTGGWDVVNIQEY